jgi:hypothetical protein
MKGANKQEISAITLSIGVQRRSLRKPGENVNGSVTVHLRPPFPPLTVLTEWGEKRELVAAFCLLTAIRSWQRNHRAKALSGVKANVGFGCIFMKAYIWLHLATFPYMD